jgi:DNA-binding NtrC family response regulator
MPDQDTAKGTILLLGLEDGLAAELAGVLARQVRSVHKEPFGSARECLNRVKRLRADLIFCPCDRQRYLSLLEAVGRQKPDLPVVVVSRQPEVSEWLDAIEAGATDYCAPPFEISHIRWILDSALKHRSTPTLYRAAG